MKRASLSWRLVFSILMVTVPALLVLLLYVNKTAEQLLVDAAKQKSELLADKLSITVNLRFEHLQSIPETLALSLGQMDRKNFNYYEHIRKIIAKTPEAIGMAVAFIPKDNIYRSPYCFKTAEKMSCKDLSENNYNYHKQNWFITPLKTGTSLWSAPYFDEGGGDTLMMTYSVPFYNRQNELSGVVTLDISIDWVSKLLSSIQISKSGYAFITDDTSFIISHPNSNFMLKESLRSLGEKLHFPLLITMANKIKKKQSGFMRTLSISINRDSWVYFTPLAVNNWTAFLVFPEDELLAGLNQIKTRFISLELFVVALIILIIILFSKKLTRPLKTLLQATKEVSRGKLDTPIPNMQGLGQEVEELGESFALMQVNLKEHIEEVVKMTGDKNRIEQELEIARSIQEGMVIRNFPPYPEFSQVDLFAKIIPAKEVGGDLYDCLKLSDDKLAVVIGDVSGKGIPASLYMALTISLLRALKSESPQKMMNRLNRELCRDNDNMIFVTLLIAVIDLKSGILHYCNAGHNPGLLFRKTELLRLNQVHGPALGVWDGKYQETEMHLGSDDLLVLYTDGITEAMASDKTSFYGEKKLIDAIEKARSLTPHQVTSHLIEQVLEFQSGAEQHDDLTLLVLRYKGDK